MLRLAYLLAVSLALTACAPSVAPPPAASQLSELPVAAHQAVTEVDYRFQTRDGQTLVAKLTLPAEARTPVPVVIFIGGSGTWDSDYAQRVDAKTLNVLLPVADWATRSAQAGIAFVRYQKRGVVDPGAALVESWRTATLFNLLDDLRALLAKVKADPRLDGSRIALLGHSEGTMLATWVGANDPSVKAYVFLGFVRRNLKEVYRFQLVNRNGNRLFAFADTQPQDDLLEASEIAAATRKGLNFGNWRRFDRDRDGRLSKEEYLTLLDRSYEDWVRMIVSSTSERLVPGNGSPAGWFQQHFRHEPVGETWRRLWAPVLVIQGKSDTNTPFDTEVAPFAAMLAAKGHPDHRVVGLEGLDHWYKDSSGVSQANRTFDLFLPWLKHRL